MRFTISADKQLEQILHQLFVEVKKISDAMPTLIAIAKSRRQQPCTEIAIGDKIYMLESDEEDLR